MGEFAHDKVYGGKTNTVQDKKDWKCGKKCYFYKMIRESFIRKMPFEQRQDMRLSHVDRLGKSVPGRRNKRHKSLEQGYSQHVETVPGSPV